MGHQGVKNIDALINAHLAVNQWLQRFFLFVSCRSKCNDDMLTVESWVSEYTFIGCVCPLPWPTYYFPKAFWNNHVTVNKTVIQTAADEYHLHAPRGCSDTGENKQTLFCFFSPPLSGPVCCWRSYNVKKSNMMFISDLQSCNKKQPKWDRKGEPASKIAENRLQEKLEIKSEQHGRLLYKDMLSDNQMERQQEKACSSDGNYLVKHDIQCN